MKKIICVLLCLCCLTACGLGNTNTTYEHYQVGSQGVFDFGWNKDHYDLFFRLNGDLEQLFGFTVRRAARVDYGTAACAEFLCGIHNRVRKACIDDAEDNFVLEFHAFNGPFLSR